MHGLPCCHGAESRPVMELPHLYGFDFDLHQCTQCSQYWVYAWREPIGGWETVPQEDAARMRTLAGPEILAFMKQWAAKFR